MKPLPSRATASAKLARAAASVATRRPPAMIHCRLEAVAIIRALPKPDHDAHDDAAARDRRARRHRAELAVTGRPELARRHREREDDDRCGDAVVQSALHVQHSTQPERYPLVVDDLRAEGSVRGGQRRPDEAGERPGEVIEHHGCQERAEDDRERKTDPQQAAPGTAMSRRSSDTFTRAASENSRSARVSSANRWTEGVSTSTTSGPQSGVGEHVPGDGEDDGAGDVGAGQQARGDRPRRAPGAGGRRRLARTMGAPPRTCPG